MCNMLAFLFLFNRDDGYFTLGRRLYTSLAPLPIQTLPTLKPFNLKINFFLCFQRFCRIFYVYYGMQICRSDRRGKSTY